MMTEAGFVHSVKVPALYKSAAKIVEQVLERGGSIKQLLYTTVNKSKLRGVYALITKTMEHNAEIEAVLEKVELLKENPRFNIYLAKVLVSELVLGKGILQGNSKPVQTILSYQEAIQSAFKQSKHKISQEVCKPRYVRVNTLKMTCDEVIKILRMDGWELVPHNGNLEYPQFMKMVRALTPDQFIRDLHVKDLLVFPPGTEFFNYPLYQDATIILQDKASCLPALVLSPSGENTVLDMCAAPGMKTTLLCSLMRGKGAVYAVEQNERRMQTLQKLINAANCPSVSVIHGDSLTLKEDWVDKIDMVLVDPTCSGTGMTERAKLFTEEHTSAARIKKLSAFQFRLLMHALTGFPAARRVVYSTCSVLIEENESVVAAVLSKLPQGQWAVKTAMPNWPSRGSGDFPFGADCLTARPSEDLTTGFFIALFERNEGASESGSKQGKKMKKRKSEVPTESTNGDIEEFPRKMYQNKKHEGEDCPIEAEVSVAEEVADEEVLKKKKKKRKDREKEDLKGTVNAEEVEGTRRKSKKRKNAAESVEDDERNELENHEDDAMVLINEDQKKSKKKRKKSKDRSEECSEVTISASETENLRKKKKKKRRNSE